MWTGSGRKDAASHVHRETTIRNGGRERRTFATRMRGDAHVVARTHAHRHTDTRTPCWHCERARGRAVSSTGFLIRLNGWRRGSSAAASIIPSFEALRGRSTVPQQRMPRILARILRRTCFPTILLAQGKYSSCSFHPIYVRVTYITFRSVHSVPPRFFTRIRKVKCFSFIRVIWISCCGCKRKKVRGNVVTIFEILLRYDLEDLEDRNRG